MNPTRHRLAASSLLLLAPLAGCATVSPPPSVMALQGASQGPVDGTEVTAFGALSQGLFIDGAAGGGARVAHRFSRELSVGVDGVAGGHLETRSEQSVPRRLLAGRAHLQLNPRGSEHLALTFGAGGGATNNSLSYVTLDAGARVSRRFADGVFEPYAGAVVALSVPTATPPAAVYEWGNDRRFTPTLYGGLDLGFALHPTERLDVSLDLLMLAGYSASKNAMLGVASVGVRYAFGGETLRR